MTIKRNTWEDMDNAESAMTVPILVSFLQIALFTDQMPE